MTSSAGKGIGSVSHVDEGPDMRRSCPPMPVQYSRPHVAVVFSPVGTDSIFRDMALRGEAILTEKMST